MPNDFIPPKQGKYAGFGNIKASWHLAKILEEFKDDKLASKIMRSLTQSLEIFKEISNSNLSIPLKRTVSCLIKEDKINQLEQMMEFINLEHPQGSPVIFLSIKTHAMNTLTTFSRNAAKGTFVTGWKPSRIQTTPPKQAAPPPRYVATPPKPLAEIIGWDIPPGLDAEDVASDTSDE